MKVVGHRTNNQITMERLWERTRRKTTLVIHAILPMKSLEEGAELQCGAWKSWESLRFPVGKQSWYLNLPPQLQHPENTHCVGTETCTVYCSLKKDRCFLVDVGTCANLSQGSCFWPSHSSAQAWCYFCSSTPKWTELFIKPRHRSLSFSRD